MYSVQSDTVCAVCGCFCATLYVVVSSAVNSKQCRVHTDPGKSWEKKHRSWKIQEKSWNFKVVVLEILLPAAPVAGSPSSLWFDLHIIRCTARSQ